MKHYRIKFCGKHKIKYLNDLCHTAVSSDSFTQLSPENSSRVPFIKYIRVHKGNGNKIIQNLKLIYVRCFAVSVVCVSNR